MATALDAGSITVDLFSRIKNAGDLSTAIDPFSFLKNFPFTDGVGALQAKTHWHDERQLAASASEELDLAGVLTNLLGELMVFTKVKAILVFAKSTNTNNVEVGGAAANAFLLFKAAADTAVLPPNGLLLLVFGDATGRAVTAGTGDKLKIANSGAGSVVDYQIFVLGSV